MKEKELINHRKGVTTKKEKTKMKKSFRIWNVEVGRKKSRTIG